jgi:hypothetical protein
MILIAGDSFAAKWPNTNLGWVNLLEQKYQVVNLAQAGVGEYKILKQLQSINIKDFSTVIVSHTSPSRLHTPAHPLHKQGFHESCDLLANDVIDRCSVLNPSLRAAQGWFKYHYDDQYQIDIYNLIRQQINNIITVPYISLTHVDIATEQTIEFCNLDFSDLWREYRGSINHYTEEGNRIVFDRIVDQIEI